MPDTILTALSISCLIPQIPLYTRGNAGKERLTHLSKVSQLLIGRAGVPTQAEWRQRPCLKNRVNLLSLLEPSTGQAMGTKEGVCWP